MNSLSSNSLTVRFLTTAVIVMSSDIHVISESYKEGKQETYIKPILRLDSGEPVNETHLVSEYILTCGSNNDLCHPQKAPFNISVTNTSGCLRTTNCNKDCAMSQSCSPDAENAFLRVSCVSTDIFPASMLGIQMVTKCHQYTTVEPNVLKLCNNIGDVNDTNIFDETFKPVISQQPHIVYRNKHCAACYNVLDTIPFKLELTCDRYFDINSFSSQSEMLQSIKASNCSIRYVPPMGHVATCSVSLNYVSVCNVSGLWFYYDPHIDWACQNFNSFPYKGYKNIFCYICNPSIVSTSAVQMINSCNMTKNWVKKDALLERGCLELPTANRTYPFKNRFCQLCNGFASGFRHFNNFSLTISERDLHHTTIKITFHNISLADGSPNEDQISFDNVRSNVDRVYDNALMELGRFCGDVDICPEMIGPFLDTITESNSNCFFSCDCGKNGCLDLIPTDTCKRGRKKDIFSERCGNSTMGYILDKILVRSETTYRVYKSIYCARCNGDIGELESESFDVTCSKPLEASLLNELTDLSQIITANDCEIESLPPPYFNTFYPKFQTFFSKCKSSCIRKCTNRKYWLKNNKKVLELCETEHLYFSGFPSIIFNVTTYKNVFCLMCNREVTLHSEEDLISACSDTGYRDVTTATLCHNVSSYSAWYPFKNIFCAACNGYNIYMDTWSTNCEGAGCIVTMPSYRAVFSLRSVQLPDEGNRTNKFEDMSATFCPKGRTLIGRVCKLLIEETAYLGYKLTFGLRLKNISYPATVSLDLYCLRQEILKHCHTLSKSIAVVQIYFDTGDCQDHEQANFVNHTSHLQCYDNQDIVIQRNSSRGNKVNRHTTGVIHELAVSVETKLNLSVLLYVQSTKNRTELEEELLKFNNLVLNVSSNVGFLQLGSFPVDHRTECRTASQNYNTCHYSIQDQGVYTNIIDDMGIKFVNVDGLLACLMTAIQMEKDIVERLCTNSIPFQVTDDKQKIILCIDDWETISLREQPVKLDLFQYAHGIFSVICTLLSVSCLFFTFFTYLLFRSLRNIPGINNMNLVFALFWAQLLLQFGLWQTEYPNLCIFLGIANHYFWLASFFSMSVCSYHMFKVFHTLMLISESINKRIVIYYSIYIYGAPLIIISVFLIVISKTSNLKLTGYGKDICFLSNHTFILTMFVAPALLVILTDIFFFAVAYWHIRSSPRLGNTSNRNDFIIYFKLMTVTGVAWIFLFIDTLNPLSVFSFIATLASALQGFYIFIAFICNAKVCSLYRNKFCRNIILNKSGIITSSELTHGQFVQTQETHI